MWKVIFATSLEKWLPAKAGWKSVPDCIRMNLLKPAATVSPLRCCTTLTFTGEQAYLDNAKFLAEGSFKVFFKYTEEDIPYIADLPWFNLVLFRGYHDLFNITGDSKYVDAMIKGLDYAWDHARDQAGLMYHDWTGRTDEKRQPKWLLDASCIPEYYARVAMIKNEVKTEK